MKIFKTIRAYRQWRSRVKGFVGLVPTMGALHAGHGSLIERSVKENDHTVVSIFVNPLQFGKTEDLSRYPRPLRRDLRLCRAAGVSAVFMPPVQAMYPHDRMITVDPGPLGTILCGADRPGHFRGVLTVVLKLFMIVQPDQAYFGKKDFQQYVLIKRMVSDLNLPVKITGCPIVREAGGLAPGPAGLALSSRNRYLSREEKKDALLISRGLYDSRARFRNGVTAVIDLLREIRKTISAGRSNRLIYAACVDPSDLRTRKTAAAGDVIALAVRTGTTRLIDNMEMR